MNDISDYQGDCFRKISQYALETSSPESFLLEELRRETLHHIHGGHMVCGPVVGQFLGMLIKLSKAKYCLEIGTFTGYSALSIAQALPVDGHLITFERNPIGVDLANRFFERSAVGHKIELCFEDVFTVIDSLTTTFDFAFIDGNKRVMHDYYEAVLAKMRPGGLIVIDNTLFQGKVIAPNSDRAATAVDAFNHFLANDKRVDNVHLTIKDGMQLVYVK